VSVAVELADLRDRVAEHGPVAFLVTVGDDGSPHAVSTRVEMPDDAVVAACGRTTAANAGRRPDVTLLWPARPGADYCLIVDGTATVDADAGRLTLQPVRAVLHRMADAGDGGPSCVTVVDQRPGR
jgi:hypothetical protein